MSAEAPRESGAPIPAQRVARLPYETPTMEILLDTSVPYPRDPNFGVSSNIGRFEPIPPVVDTFASHPKGIFDRISERVAKAGSTIAQPVVLAEIVGGGVTGATVAAIVQPDVPTAEASGFIVREGAEYTTAECIDGVILVQKTPAPIAVAGGADVPTTDQTTTEPAAAVDSDGEKADTVTEAGVDLPQDVEIALGNGIILVNAPDCPPTPADLISSTQYLEQVLLTQNSSDIVDRTDTQISTKIDNFWSKYGDYINSYPDPTSIKEGAVLSKKTLIEYLGYLVSGQDNDQQSAAASGEIALLLAIDEKVSRDTNIPRDVQIKIRKNLRSIGDMLYDYARLNVKGGIKDFLESDIKDLFTFYIGKYGIILS